MTVPISAAGKDEPAIDPSWSVLMDDALFAVIAKSGNMPCHAGGRYRENTLEAMLRSAGWGEVHFVSRLDRETSGAVVVAKTAEAASKYSLSYATGGRDAFFARVEREVRERVDSRIKAYSQFRKEFTALAEPIMKKYSAFGDEILQDKLKAMLMQQSTQKTFPKAKSFAVAFDGMLNKALNEKIAMKEEEFVVYWKKIEKIYDKCVAAFNNKVKEMEQTLRDAGATDGDIEYLNQTLMPIMRSQLDTEIQQKPEAYAQVKGGNDFGVLIAEAKADTLMYAMKIALEEIQISKREGLVQTLLDIKLREFAFDDEALDLTKETIATWMKGENTPNVLANARRGKMLLAVIGATDTGTIVDEAKKNVQTFKDELKALLLGMRTTVLEGEFKTEQVEPAVKLFKIWLAQYNLPKLTVVSKDYGTGTIEQLASEHFRHHIADMQKELAERTMKGENPPEDGGEALLSAKYVTSLVQFINEIGVKTECYKKIAERVELMKRIANSAPKPGQATEILPINGMVDEKGNVFNHLTRNLFCTVKSHVEAEAMSKDKATKKLFKSISSAIVKVEDVKVK